jgi:flagellin-like hook-associated protein FlgL
MDDEMSDITLTSSSRSALTSLQGTGELLGRTQGRLTSGLKVASAIDNAVSYFKAKGLDERAADFSGRKDEIDQGISSLKAAVNGTSIADSVMKQMKGIVNSVRTADASTRATLSSQFNDLAKQLNSAVADASFQGLNLVANSTASLTVYFNQGTGATLQVNAQNLQASVLLTAAQAANQPASANVLSIMMAGGGGAVATLAGGFSVLSDSSSTAAVLDNIAAQMDASISTLRSSTARLGGNVTFLQTRLDFTKNYINTMKEGSSKLTLADLNEEGANMVALQTRQQIGVQSLSLAGQQQQAILSLLK